MKAAVCSMLAASVLLNIYLLFSRGRPLDTSTTLSKSNRELTVHPVPQTNAIPGSNERSSVADTNLSRRFGWANIESPDYKTYVSNLRAIGCPPETIDDIVSRDLQKNFKAKEWEVLRHAAITQYWTPSFQLATRLESEQLRAIDRLSDEFNRTHKDLLGSEPADLFLGSSHGIEMEILARYGDLPWETIEQIAPIQKRLYADLRHSGSDTPHANELIQKSEENINSLLNDEQRDVAEMRQSPLAKRLRSTDLSLDLDSEERFRAAFIRAKIAIGNSRDVDSITDEQLASLVK